MNMQYRSRPMNVACDGITVLYLKRLPVKQWRKTSLSPGY
jgi:hypothetical protein